MYKDIFVNLFFSLPILDFLLEVFWFGLKKIQMLSRNTKNIYDDKL